MDNEEIVSKAKEEISKESTEEGKLTSDKIDSMAKKSLFKSNYFKAAIIFSFLIVVIMIFGIVKTNSLINTYADVVYPESYVLDTDISALSKDTLHTSLETLIGELGNTKIKITIGDKIFETTYKDMEVTIPYDDFEETILDFGKDKNFFTKLNLIRKPEKKNYQFEFLYNEDKLNSFLSNIGTAVNISPVNSTINISNGNISISESKGGYVLNCEELLTNFKEAIKDISPKNELTLNATLQPVTESIKKDDLALVTNKISTFTTSFPAGPSGINLQLAAKNINNTLIMPGETFSCEKGIGPTTPENGFVLANTYVSGKIVKNYGGGVCQVASTLYNTILRAGIIPIERQNHMMTVAYVPMGLDATLADNAIDLKFKNDYDYPIVINSTSGNGKLTIDFWSNPSVLNDLTYEPKSYQKSSLSADAYLYSYDKNGTMVSEKFLDTSTYQPFSN